jgi:hypothetical protein
MPDYYTDDSKKSLWVLSSKEGFTHDYYTLTCFAAENDSGFHVGQRVNNPKLQNSNWKPLEGQIIVTDILC